MLLILLVLLVEVARTLIVDDQPVVCVFASESSSRGSRQSAYGSPLRCTALGWDRVVHAPDGSEEE